MRMVDLDDDAHVFCGEDGEYEKWNIDTSKTVDAVPVIRCKDCIHHHGHDCENMNYRRTSDDFYCGWVERKEE